MSTPAATGARRLARRSGLRFFGVLCASGAFALTAGAGSALAQPTFTQAWGWAVSNSTPQFETCNGTCRTGEAGPRAGEMDNPAGVAYGSNTGDVYVADPDNDRVDVFTASGSFVMAIGGGVNNTNDTTNSATGTYNYCTSNSTCQAGNGSNDAVNGDLKDPSGVAVSGSDIFVADTGNSRVAEFSVSGASATYLGSFGASGTADNEMIAPTDVAVSGSDVYVVDSGNDRVDEWSFNNTPTYAVVNNFGGPGTAAGDMQDPDGIAVNGSVYVADTGNDRIDVFSTSGTFQQAFGGGVRPASSNQTCNTSTTCQAGNGGGASGDLDEPTGVTVDFNGFIYVTDNGNERIDEFNSPGNFTQAWGWNVTSGGTPRFQVCTSTCESGNPGGGAGELDFDTTTPLIGGIAVDNNGDVFVGDTFNQRVDEFSVETFESTTTSLFSSVNPSTTGQAVTFTAEVNPDPGGGVVSFTDDGSSISNCIDVPVNTSGSATCTITFSNVGQQTIQATFGGNNCFEFSSCNGFASNGNVDYESSSSLTFVQTIQAPASPPPPAPTATVTQLLASASSAVTGEVVQLSALVTPVPSGGTVAFYNRGVALPGCAAVPVTAGKALCDASFAGPGTEKLTDVYSGNSAYTGSGSAILLETVTSSLSLSGKPKQSGEKVKVTLACAAGSGGCAGTTTLTARYKGKTITLASGSSTLAAGATKTITLTLSKTAQKDLAKALKLGATVTVVLTSGGQHAASGTATLTLKQPVTKKHK